MFWAFKKPQRERHIVDIIGAAVRSLDSDAPYSIKANAIRRVMVDEVARIHENTDAADVRKVQERMGIAAPREDTARITCDKYEIPYLRM